MDNTRVFTPSSVQVVELWAPNAKNAVGQLFSILCQREDDPLVVAIDIDYSDHGPDHVLLTAFLDDCEIPEPVEKVPYG